MKLRRTKFAAALAGLAILGATGGCTRYARLYNLGTGEVLQAKFTDSAAAGGKLTITMPWGEVLTGEYTVMRGGSVQWGQIYALVYSPQGMASGQGFGSSSSMDRLNRGSAIATGPQGTILECEFLADSVAGNAQGGCKDNKGNTYRLIA